MRGAGSHAHCDRNISQLFVRIIKKQTGSNHSLRMLQARSAEAAARAHAAAGAQAATAARVRRLQEQLAASKAEAAAAAARLQEALTAQDAVRQVC